MNMNNNPNERQLRALLFACDDRAGHHILWVNRIGDVHITQLGSEPLEQWAERMGSQMQFHYEVFEPGNHLVGPSAASNAEYIAQAFDRLLTDWNEGNHGKLVFETKLKSEH